ncbi:MAG: hypothetical protein JNL09_02505 [Anaerolineales bacterium]|nr:hypothetical protein [Anaerolineales bacterium]
MSTDLYKAFYPERWSVSQQKAVEAVCAAEEAQVWVTSEAGTITGFVAVKRH